MAEVRLRQTGNARLKTLDRAAIAKDHVVEHSLRTKEQIVGRQGGDNTQPSGYATDQMGQGARRGYYGAEQGAIRGAKALQRQIIRRKNTQSLRIKRHKTVRFRDEMQGFESAKVFGSGGSGARSGAERSVFGKRNVKVRGKTVYSAGQKAQRQELAQKRARKEAMRRIRQQAVKASGKTKRSAKQMAIRLARAMRRAVQSSRALIAMLVAGGSVAVLAIMICVLFGAAYATFGDESSDNYIEVSPEVQAYTPLITQYADRYGIGEYVELIKAVMMQESGGRGTDPMQCSESPYNKRYSHAPNSIKSAEYSIDCGVHYLADCLEQAKCKSPVDMSRIRLALQGYNYGNGYIPWAIRRDGGYTVENAAAFSDLQAKKHGWSGYGDKQYVSHVLRYYPYGSYNIGVGNTAITKLAASQIGNHGGRKFWSWYGYSSRVSWCGCYVSWLGAQCGYVKAGIFPKFSSVPDGVNWFKNRHQWQGRSYKPSPGDLIFFDWYGNGTRDHVGIVERCDGKCVYTIEGNTSDQVARRSYPVGYYEILGYGIVKY